jgi:hypothetical protein
MDHRGANSVVIMTTKRGKKNGNEVSYNVYAGVSADQ